MRPEWLQRPLDAALAASPRARELCSQLAGRTLLVKIEGTPWQVALRAEADRLRVDSAAAPDVVIAGTPLALLELSTTADPALLRSGVVRIEGDAALAQQFQAVAQLLQPDLEELVGRFAGRIPTHLLFTGVRGALRWGQQAARSALQTSAEYLAHESRDLVPQTEAEQFQRGVEQLREQLDRLEARVGLLAGSQGRAPGGSPS